MDLLRSTLKVLFYDYHADAVASHIKKGNSRNSEDFFSLVKELMTWREKGFSSSEVSLLRGIMENDWLIDEESSFGKDAPYHPYERLGVILEKCAHSLLNITAKNPRVQIRHLLRWRDLSLLIGEDNLIIPLLAKSDLKKGFKRESFLWPNVIGHDDIQLNGVLNETLSDTHFHLNAGCDVFEFNWIIIMNNPECLFEKVPDFMQYGERRVYDPIRRHSDINLDLRDWCILATYLRALLINIVFDDSFEIDFNSLSKIFDSSTIHEVINRIPNLIEPFRRKAQKTSNGIIFDYAIFSDNIRQLNSEEICNVYMAHHGERWFLYNFFYKYFGCIERIRRYAPILYLYILIKNKFRREIIQTNDLRGFENFQIYQKFKNHFFHHSGDMRDITETAFRYAIQSAMGEPNVHNIEARVTPGSISLYQELDFKTSLFGNQQVIDNNTKALVSLVCHFIKKSDDAIPKLPRKLRHKKFRNNLNREFKYVERAYLQKEKSINKLQLVGIDAASNELECRPEVFAPVYKMSQSIGLSNFTYHVGEDFYDIVDGLRAIDEAIRFLNLSSGCRVGHAIALGTDTKRYYESRHRYIIIPKQNLLDNLVWMKYTAMENNISLNPRSLLFISEEYHRLITDLHYDDNGVDSYYWDSMKLRGEDPLTYKYNPDSIVDSILDTYWNMVETREKGRETVAKQLPEAYVEDVAHIQACLFRRIVQRGIFIETNPTSNYMIGGFSKYIELPLFKFHSIGSEGHKLPVSINTDDKGVFATSLKNEYSLVAVALRKQKDTTGNRIWNDKQITDYLRQLAYYGNLSRFTIDP